MSDERAMRVLEITRPCFTALARLRASEVRADAGRVRQQLRDLIEAMQENARRRSLGAREAEEMAYALVALTDEIALGRPEPFASEWAQELLQVQCFGENIAGDEFFRRLEQLITASGPREVLLVFYLCLLFGFQGRYGIRGGEAELLRITDRTRAALGHALSAPETLSARGDRPDEAVARRGRGGGWVALAVLAVVLTVAGYVGLRLSLEGRADTMASRLNELER